MKNYLKCEYGRQRKKKRFGFDDSHVFNQWNLSTDKKYNIQI